MRRSLAAGLLVAGIWLFSPQSSYAQIDEIKIGVDGLSCNLCAAGLERSLRKLDAVSSVQIALADESATVRLKSGATFDPEKLRTAVKNAGQAARVFEIRLSAAVQRQDGRYTLQPGRSASVLAVRRESEPRLEGFVGKVVRVRARVPAAGRLPLEWELTEVAAP